jgi:Flp pilus assembly protein TadB
MLSISDWIAFLTSEKNPNISNIISFSALFLAAFAIIMSVTSNTVVGAVVLALIAVALAIIYLRTISPYGRHAKVARELLNDIMSGKERDLLKIEESWKLETSFGGRKAEE